MPLSTRLALAFTAELSSTPALGSLKAPLELAKTLAWGSGTGADQADKIYTASASINASTTLSLDLNGGGLLDPTAAAFAIAKLKAIVLCNDHASQALSLTRPAANGVPFLTAAGDAVPVPGGGFVALGAGLAGGLATVTAGTGDLIDIVNGAGSAVPYRLVIVGTSA